MSLSRVLLLEYNQSLRKKLSEKFQKEEPRLEDRVIQSYLDRFKELKHRFPSDKRDVTKLTWKEIEGLVDSFVSTKAKLGNVKISTDANLVYDDGDGIRIFHGKDKDSCIKYSTGYTFCIGSKDQGRNMYDSYRTTLGGGSPYFIVNQNLPTEALYHMSVVYVHYDNPNEFTVTDSTNDHDNEKVFHSKQQLKKFYENEFGIELDNKFVNVIKPVKLDIVNEIIKPIDKGSYYLSKGYVNLFDMGLTSLEFFDKPWVVEGNFYCSNNQLTTLEGAPKEVGGNFYCFNNQLTSLEGAPHRVGGGFSCYNNKLTTLEGAPKEVGGNFYCFNNQLTTLQGAPQEVGRNFYCSDNNLTTLEGAPQRVGGDFSCSSNKLTTLQGAPQEVGGHFDCSDNQLTTLEGAPQEVGGHFDCSDNQLTTLEGAPQRVEGNFSCSSNKLTTLKGAPQEVGRNFYCSNNPNLPQEEIDRYLRSIGKKK